MDRHSKGGDRRTSLRNSISNDGADDEDYALAAVVISDGVRPADLDNNRVSPQNSPAHDRRTSNIHPYRDLRSVPIPPPRPSSISKPNHESLTLRHDGAMGPIAARNAAATTSNTILSRSSSVSTDVTLRPESPYQGPSRPSHPYQMYPQESRLARTASVATTSSAPIAERLYAGPNAPTFPYGMYPQNTVPESENEHDEQTPVSVPVGFPGRGNTYQRRLGPDGEEIADIIGPDGHTEQLPPYSQYPDEAFARKNRPMVQLPDASGAGGIGLATRNPEFASRDDLDSPDSRLSSRSLTVVDSDAQINTAAAAVVSEKPPLKKWQKFAKRKVCGVVPVWALILAATVLVVFVLIMILVLVALKPHHHHQNDGGNNITSQGTVFTTTLTTTFDATPLSTAPASISTLATGPFAVEISSPTTQQSGCLQNSAHDVAWSCEIAPAVPYQMDISSIPGGSPTSDIQVTLTLGDNDLHFLPYGAQVPIMSQNQTMELVIDSQNASRGPAWFFQARYNKIVVLPEFAFEAPSNEKRHGEHNRRFNAYSQRRGTVQPGDNPWICYWNGTLLETFIYADQSSTSTSSNATTTTSSSAVAAAASTYPPNAGPSGFSDPDFLSPCPKLIKIQERRVPSEYQSTAPYCVQQQVDDFWAVKPLLNSSGQPVVVYLNESEPASVSPLAGRSSLAERLEERDRYLRERDATQECGCVWVTG